MYVPPGNISVDLLFQGDVFPSYPFLSDDTSRSIILISQTCDAQRRENILVAPIFTFSEMEGRGVKPDTLKDVRLRRINYWFYLPPLDGVLEESLVDLQQIKFSSRIDIDNRKSTKIITLNDWGRHHLAWSISNFFGRPTLDPIAC
jgi:hypothetical protein